MPKMLISQFQSHSTKIEDIKINPINPFNLSSTKGGGGVKMVNILLGMSYNMPKMVSPEFWSHSIKIQDFKINPINPFNSISIKGGE